MMDIYQSAKYVVDVHFGIYIDAEDVNVNISFMRDGWLDCIPNEYRDVFSVRAGMFLNYLQSETRLMEEVYKFLYQVNHYQTLMEIESVIRNVLYRYEVENQVSLSDLLIGMLIGEREFDSFSC